MSNDQEKTPEQIKFEDFMKIKDIQDNVIYETNPSELEDVLQSTLLTGKFVKTFKLFNGLLELTYETITDAERNVGYALMRDYAKEHDEASRIMLDSYTSKINMALQLSRISIKGNSTNLQQADIKERIALLGEQPEDTLRACSKYLMIFANLTSRAFSSEEVLKN